MAENWVNRERIGKFLENWFFGGDFREGEHT
jgi:hypothetical protein